MDCSNEYSQENHTDYRNQEQQRPSRMDEEEEFLAIERYRDHAVAEEREAEIRRLTKEVNELKGARAKETQTQLLQPTSMDGPSPFSDALMRKNRVLGEQVRFENHDEVDGAHDSRYRPALCKSAGKKNRRQYGGLASTYGLRDLPEPGFTLGTDQCGEEDHLDQSTPYPPGPTQRRERSHSQPPFPSSFPNHNEGRNCNNSQADNQLAAPVLNYLPDPRNVSARQSIVKMKPDTYDGSEDFDDYEEHFSGIASLNGWDYRLRSLMLSSMLRGSARSFYLTLSVDIRSDYFQLVDQLKGRFGGQAKHPQYWVTQFEGRHRKSGETAAKFADALYLLARRAYPAGMTDFNLQQVALQQFYKSLDQEMKWKCIEKSCTELRQAVEVVEMFETFMGNNPNKKSIREVNATNDLLLSLVDRIDQLNIEQERQRSRLNDKNSSGQINAAQNPNHRYQHDNNHGSVPNRTHRNSQDSHRKPNCYACGDSSHYLRECPHLKRFSQQFSQESQMSGNELTSRQ